jgi:hypothetical protein
MRIGCVRGGLLFLSIGLAWAGAATAYEATPLTGSIYHASVAGASSLYELADPLPLSSARWDPLADSRLELSTGLLPGHEVLMASNARASGWAGSEVSFSGIDPTWALDPLRATYRYTFLERSDWAWKVGLTTRLGDIDPTRAAATSIDRARFGGLPQVHLAGQGRLAKDWLLTLDADGLLTARGRALDLGVRVNYVLSRSVYLFGGYRLSDHYFEGEDISLGLTNSANVGVRYRF